MGKALILEDIPDLVRCVILFKVDLIRVFVRLDPIYRAIPHRLIILGNRDTLLQILNRRCKSLCKGDGPVIFKSPGPSGQIPANSCGSRTDCLNGTMTRTIGKCKIFGQSGGIKVLRNPSSKDKRANPILLSRIEEHVAYTCRT